MKLLIDIPWTSFNEIVFYTKNSLKILGKVRKFPKQIVIEEIPQEKFIEWKGNLISRTDQNAPPKLEENDGIISLFDTVTGMGRVSISSDYLDPWNLKDGAKYQWQFLRHVTKDFFFQYYGNDNEVVTKLEEDLIRKNYNCEVDNFLRVVGKRYVAQLSLMPIGRLKLNANLNLLDKQTSEPQKILLFSGYNLDVLESQKFLYFSIKLNAEAFISVFSKYREFEFRVYPGRPEPDIVYHQQFQNRPQVLLERILNECKYAESMKGEKESTMPYLWYWSMPNKSQIINEKSNIGN